MDDLRRNVIFDNVQVTSKGDITGKLASGSGLDETETFEHVFQQMNEHFDNDQMVSIINYNPRQNEICACKFDGQWHRVRVEYILARKNGNNASCIFVDEGVDKLVPVSWLRQLPGKFQQVAYQVKRLTLHGIQPVSMVISEDATPLQKPVKVWDESAVRFINECIKAAARVKCVLIECHSDCEMSVRMYLEKQSGGGAICLNEVLVKQRYAISVDDAREMSKVSPKPKKTIQEVIRIQQEKQQRELQQLSCSDDTDMGAKSDTEFTLRSRHQDMGDNVGREKGYETDCYGVSAMQHRARCKHLNSEAGRPNVGGGDGDGSWIGGGLAGETQAPVGRGITRCTSEEVKSQGELYKDLAGYASGSGSGSGSQRGLLLGAGDSDNVLSDRTRVATGLSSSEEDSFQVIPHHRLMANRSHQEPNLTSSQQTSNHPVPRSPQLENLDQTEFVSSSLNRPSESHHSSFTTSPLQHKAASPLQSSAISQVQHNSGSPLQHNSVSPLQHNTASPLQHTSSVPSQSDSVSPSMTVRLGRGGVKLETGSPKYPSTSPKVGLLSNIQPTLGRGSPSYGRGALLSSTESLTKRLSSPHTQSDSEMLSAGVGRSVQHGRPVVQTSTESLNTSCSKLLDAPRNLVEKSTPVMSEKSPKFGRGALLSSAESLDAALRPKQFLGDGVVRPKEVGDSNMRQGYQGSESSDGEILKSLSRKHIEKAQNVYDKSAYSETELPGSKHSHSANTADHRRTELSQLGAFDDAVVQSDSQLTSAQQSAGTQSGGRSGRMREQGPHDYSSGCESSSSSIVTAAMLGQANFKKSRVPRVGRSSGGETSDTGTRQRYEISKQSLSPVTKMTHTMGTKKSPSKVDMLQTMMKKMADQELAEKAERPAEDSILESALSGNKKAEMLGKFTGQKLLEKLGPGARPTQSVIRTTAKKTDQEKGMFGASQGVLVHGRRPPKPLMDFNYTYFTEHVKQAWETTGFAAPTIVQAYTWPAIIRGRHVVSIAPPETGKTFAYLYPLITMMSDPKIYNELPRGNGPLTIIVSNSWRQAERVYDNTCHMVANYRGMRTVLVHGGGEEDKKACTLINGCEILIVTAPSLKRLLEARYTELRRLCHLVIDDADQVLKTFSGEISHVIAEFTQVIVTETRSLESPRQILLLGSQWNRPLEEFLTKFLNEPVLIITAAFEASIYGRVKQVSHMCRSDERVKEVLGILEHLTDGSHKTIVFATKKEDIMNLFQIIRNSSHYCLMVHQEMELYQVEHVMEEWTKELNLLVCCDEYMSDMRITNAMTIIHYDLPDSKTKFSNRLACMRHSYYNFTDPDRKLVHEPTSHLIMTDKCSYKQLWHIYEMLQRTSSAAALPKRLLEMLLESKNRRDQDSNRYLCDQQMAFGYCRYTWRCRDRHVVLPEKDVGHYSDWIPDEGEVKLMVSHVIDASHYCVRLLSVRKDDNRVTEDLSPGYSRLQMDVGLWYSNLDHQKRETAPYVGEVCGYQENEVFYRVQIVEFREMNTKQEMRPIEALVKFVDTGRFEEVPAFKLYELPVHLRIVPFQAVDVFMCKLRPMDKDTEWTFKASRFIHELIHGKTLEGKIVLKLGYTLWLDPLVMRLHLGESRTIVNKFYVHTELLRNGLAVENENHLKRLHKLCDGKVKIPKALLIKTKLSQILQTDVLPACREHHDIQVSSVATPDFFFVQRRDKVAELEELMSEIKAFVEMMDDGVNPPDIAPGTYCLAQYDSYDKSWYRGQILRAEEDEYEVFFADYGDKDMVPRDKVRDFPNDRFFELPLQAIECQIAHIKPTGNKYETKAGDLLWDVSHFLNDDLKQLVATVTGKTKATSAGQARFLVELRSEELDLASELVWRKLARPEEGSPVVHLFSKPVGLRRRIMSSCLLIPELCASLYWESESSRALSIAEEILSILNRAGESLAGQISGSTEAVRCLVKLVGRLPWDSVHRIVLDSLICVSRANDQFVEEMLNVDIVRTLICCLEMISNNTLQQQAADFIVSLSNLSTAFRTVFQSRENLGVLHELFDNSQCQQVQGAVCRAFTALCSGSETVFDYLMEKSVCPTLVKYLAASADHGVTEALILLTSTLSELDSSHADLKKETLIEALVKNLRKTTCDKCIQHSVQMCDNFAATRRKHKTFLLEVEMVAILKRLLTLELQPPTKQLCKDLMSSLIIKVPSEPLSGVTVRAQNREPETSSSSGLPPNVYWSQNSFNVILSVKLSNVPHRKNIVAFKEDEVMFRLTLGEVAYSFTYKLYGNILEASSKVAIRSHEILISMKKQNQGKWPRLLHDKVKPANLFLDFERFVDSSCESEVDDTNNPFALKKKKKKPNFKGPGRPQKERKEGGESDGSTDTDDSLEQLMDPDDRPDYDPFSLAGGIG